MKRAQEIALSGREYSAGLEDLSGILSLSGYSHPLMNEKNNESKKILVILAAPEKGLCGSLITNLHKKLMFFIDENGRENIDFVCIGKKAVDMVRKLNLNIIADFTFGFSYPSFEFVTPIAKLAKEKFIDGSYGRVNFIYSDFVNTMTQIPHTRTLLPISEKIMQEQENSGYVLFEPDTESILSPFLNMYVETQMYQVILEAYASEQSSRMVSMKAATDNAWNLIGQLTIDYNKARQSEITNEILDIGNATDILNC